MGLLLKRGLGGSREKETGAVTSVYSTTVRDWLGILFSVGIPYRMADSILSEQFYIILRPQNSKDLTTAASLLMT